MKKTLLILPFLVLGIIIANGKSPHKQTASTGGDVKQAEHFMQNQKAGFEQNKGQVTGEDASRVKYTFKDKGLSIFILNNGLAYQFSKTHYPEGYKHLDKFAKHEELEKMEALQKDIRVETYRMDVTLVDANPNATITTEGKSQDYTQYYNHNALNVHNYCKITYHNVYPNIDWVIYSKGESVKYDFIVHPGGNPNQIKLQTNWVEDLKLNQDGSLTLQNRMGSITEQTPISFQGEKELKTNFNIINNHITFSVKDYNPNQTLIIDPTLQWATYYGGSGTDGSGTDSGYSCAVDHSGNVYLAGETSSTSAIASGGHQNTFGGNWDAFLVKFNSAGVRQWATYYGGSHAVMGNSCAVDGVGNVFLGGKTLSNSSIIASGGHQNTPGGGMWDAFLVKFDSAGVRQWATYYGGNGDDYGNSCAVDGSGNVYLAGYTNSTTAIASGGHQMTAGGGATWSFLVKFNTNGIRQWGTYYNSGQAFSCFSDNVGDIYLCGQTNSTNNVSFLGHQNTFGGGNLDAYLVKFNSNGIRQWGTYYGGNDFDRGNSCVVDGAGNVYIAGETFSNSAIASGGHQNTHGGGFWDAFLVKFNSTGVRQWATYYGGNGDDRGFYCALDGTSNVYLSGRSGSTSVIASGGHQNTSGGDLDAFLVKFNSDGIREWGTYYGGSGDDRGFSCALDDSGNVYLAGYTNSTSAIASGGHQNTYGGNRDAFLVKFGDTPICTPTSYSFNDSICSGASYSFAGQTLTTAGSYNDTLTNAAGCDSVITLNLIVNPKPSVSITSNLADLEATSGYSSYVWKLNNVVITGANTNIYTATTNGTYEVEVTDANGCKNIATYNYNSTNIKEENKVNLLTIYPNPTQGNFTLTFGEDAERKIQVYDSFGKLVFQSQITQEIAQINLEGFANGIYHVKITEGTKHTVKSIVINN